MPKRERGLNTETMLSGLASAKAAKLAAINSKCEDALRILTATYPDTERLTFDQQKAEAKTYLADTTAPCPMLAPLAAARGITLEDLAERVLAKADAFSAASGMLIGQRQALEDLLDEAGTEAEVMGIAVSYTLSGA